MKSHRQLAFAAIAAAAFAGCGGGGASIGSSGPPPVPAPSTSAGAVASPGAAASPGARSSASPVAGSSASPVAGSSASPVAGASASPVAGASASPAGSPSPVPSGAVLYHPAVNGDTFAFAGSEVVTYDRSNQYPSPEPTQTAAFTIAQNVTVRNPATYNGSANAVDFHTVESDQRTAPTPQTITNTIEQYDAFSGSAYAGNFLDLGFTSVDDNNYKVTVSNGSGAQIVDVLPEVPSTFTRDAGSVVTTDDSNGNTSSQTVAANGTYSETITTPNVGASPPVTNQATAVTNLDGSGDYKTPRLGTSRASNYDYSVAKPTADGSGTITETTLIPAAAGSTASPTPSSTTIPNWIPKGYVNNTLAVDSTTDNGPTALPASCPVSANFAKNPNQLVRTKVRIDPMFGEYEIDSISTYVVPNVGPACVVLSDTLTQYYDLTGQNGVGYFSGVPQQITKLDEVLYLTSETLANVARRPEARAELARAFAFRVSSAVARVQAARLQQRSARLRAIAVPGGRGSFPSLQRGIF